MVYTVERLSIGYLVALFIGYIIIHLLIAYKEKGLKQEIEDGVKDSEKLRLYNGFKFANKWFPAAYVIFVLAMLYLA